MYNVRKVQLHYPFMMNLRFEHAKYISITRKSWRMFPRHWYYCIDHEEVNHVMYYPDTMGYNMIEQSIRYLCI